MEKKGRRTRRTGEMVYINLRVLLLFTASAFEVFLHGGFMQKPEYNGVCPCSKSIWNGQTQVTITVPKGL